MPPVASDAGENNTAQGHSIQDAGIAAALDLEKTYATDGPAAAAVKLQEEYLDAMKNPVKDGAKMSQLDYEMTKLQVDSGKGDLTLIECATNWGIQLLQAQGAIDQPTLEKMASPDQTGANNGWPALDPYGQAMAQELDTNWQQVAGIGHQQTNGMDSPKITLSDLLKSREVDESIRTYRPEPQKPPTLWEKIERIF